MRRVICIVLLAALVGACSEKISHDKLDEWMQTENGPGKLADAVGNADLDPDLSAHAAVDLLLIREDNKARDALAKLGDTRRQAVTAKLGPRLWELARIEGETSAPNQQQIAAKDMLFDLRDGASDADRATIDQYLIEWYTSGYYEGRADAGRWSGAQVMRALGKQAGPGMIKAANAIVGAPATADGRHLKVGDKLLLGLAVTGDPAAVKYVCDMFGGEPVKFDPTLPERAMGALRDAYAAPPSQLFEKADPAGLVPNLVAITKIILDPDRSNHMVNDAVEVVAAAGPPACIDALVGMLNAPHSQSRYVWVGAGNALRCGQVAAIPRVAEGLPVDGQYDHDAIDGSVIAEIEKMPKDQAAQAARDLLDDKSWVARWIGVETLAKIGGKDDVARLVALGKDRAVLHGYWAEAAHKADPTLGQRATEVAKALGGS